MSLNCKLKKGGSIGSFCYPKSSTTHRLHNASPPEIRTKLFSLDQKRQTDVDSNRQVIKEVEPERTDKVQKHVAYKDAKQWGGGNEKIGNDTNSSWRLLDLSEYDYKWNVPWGLGRTAGGMGLWYTLFLSVVFGVVPKLYQESGFNVFDLDSQDMVQFSLVCTIAETIVSLAAIRVLTAGPLKENPRGDLFIYSFSNPFTPPQGWAYWSVAGLIIAGVSVQLLGVFMDYIGYDVAGKGNVGSIESMIHLDFKSYISLILTVGVLTPITEETVFRGFLLTSLTKYLPSWAAIFLSSLIFGLTHLNKHDLPGLITLGAMLSCVYMRSRNLTAPIVMHGVWNSSLLTILYIMALSGISLD